VSTEPVGPPYDLGRRPKALPRSRAGHPTQPRLTEEVEELIVQLVRGGAYLKTAAQFAGVHRETIRRWRKRGETDLQRSIESHYAAFARALARAEAQAEATRVLRILAAGENDWRANAWFLERRFPERWGAHGTVNSAVEVGARIPRSLVLDPRVTELADALLDQLARDGPSALADPGAEGEGP